MSEPLKNDGWEHCKEEGSSYEYFSLDVGNYELVVFPRTKQAVIYTNHSGERKEYEATEEKFSSVAKAKKTLLERMRSIAMKDTEEMFSVLNRFFS